MNKIPNNETENEAENALIHAINRAGVELSQVFGGKAL
jgi:hypothetical protein